MRLRETVAKNLRRLRQAKGLSQEELAALPPAQLAVRRASATRQLARAGAHYVIDSAADLEAVIDTIDGRLARGERP